MLPGLLWWGAGFVALAIGLPVLGREHPLPGYALYLGVCLLPLNVVAFLAAVRRPRTDVIAFVVQGCVVLAVTYPIQIVSTLAGSWMYFEDRDVLLGLRVGGVPIEEFFFYPLTINLAVWLYLGLADHLAGRRPAGSPLSSRALAWGCRGGALVAFGLAGWAWSRSEPGPGPVGVLVRDALGNPHFAAGPRDYAWTIVELASIGVNLLLLELAARTTALNVRALIPLAGIFFIVCFLSDLLGTSRGWWVFNSQRVSGLWIGPVPAENLPAYLTGIPLALGLYEGTRRLLGASVPRAGRRTA